MKLQYTWKKQQRHCLSILVMPSACKEDGVRSVAKIVGIERNCVISKLIAEKHGLLRPHQIHPA